MQHFIQVLGFVAVAVMFWVIRKLLAPGRSFNDFIVGDEGTYSLSRLQMVAWVFVIISLQVSVALALLWNTNVSINEYQAKFSEPILWLLGLSLGSYVTVKGITVDKIANAKVSTRYEKRLSDLITGENGLDFSRFQMLIWTLIGLFVFVAQSNIFIRELCYNANDIVHEPANDRNVRVYFMSIDDRQKLNAQYRSQGKHELKEEDRLPTISWSLLVLMGLSQGAYVGKKLVPAGKVKEVRQDRLSELNAVVSQLDIEIKNKKQESQSTTLTPQQKESIEKDLTVLQSKRDGAAKEIEEINKSLHEL